MEFGKSYTSSQKFGHTHSHGPWTLQFLTQGITTTYEHTELFRKQ